MVRVGARWMRRGEEIQIDPIHIERIDDRPPRVH
jgi:hypothetical protein